MGSSVLAAFAIASTSSRVMSACWTSISAMSGGEATVAKSRRSTASSCSPLSRLSTSGSIPNRFLGSGCRRRDCEAWMFDGYVRVSQVAGRSGGSFISPTVQRDQIEGWALSRGETIGEIFEELDESGARSDRPLLMRAIKRIETGESRGLVVAKLDRFGRSLRDGLAAIQRIRDADGVFVSVQDGLDLGTDTGKLVLHMLLSMGEWELDRLRTSWEIAKAYGNWRGCPCGEYDAIRLSTRPAPAAPG